MSERLETLAQEAYVGYGRSVDFKNYQGLPMPEWGNLTGAIRNAWEAAAVAVADAVHGPCARETA